MTSIGEGRTALVTGASSGIGFELCRLLIRDAYRVVMVAKEAEKLAAAAIALEREHAAETVIIVRDLSDPLAPVELSERLRADSIAVDILINNAGFDVYGSFHETNWSAEQEMLEVNLLALTKLTKLLLPPMLARGSGRILNVSSVMGLVPCPFNVVYAATKAYVRSFSESLAEECRGSGVTVTCLCPGSTQSNFHASAGMQRINATRGAMRAQAVAAAGYHAMQSGTRLEIPGALNKLQMFAASFLPRALTARLSRWYLSES
jgi:short-subunit dehydrogenase